ncbi:uncharacterized protein P884DRAFT_297933 [Thermothelomyces heterothallicus CBS 202.75]|uniref:uncharacterized protein n=1 Tax=Thermothelomyces heterothallicus CBS 202.75 TaxID=1149848 RepID=UPI0037425B3D
MVAPQSNGVSQQQGKGVFTRVLATLVDAASDPNAFANDGDRIQALLAAYTLVSRLETPWETVLRLVMGKDLGAAMDTVGKIKELDASDDMFVVIAHDLTLRDRIPLCPKKLNDWKERGLRSSTRWLFLRDFESVVRQQASQTGDK